MIPSCNINPSTLGAMMSMDGGEEWDWTGVHFGSQVVLPFCGVGP